MNAKKLKAQAEKLTELILEANQLRGELVALDKQRDASVYDKATLEEVEKEIASAEQRLGVLSRELRKFGIDLV